MSLPFFDEMNAIIEPLKQKAPYLDTSRNKILLIGSLAVFTFIFLSVYNPFNMALWGGSITGYVVIGASVLLFSQFVVRPALKKQKLKLFELILFGIGEILVMTLLLQLAYGPELSTFSEQAAEYFLTLKFVCLILVGPYVLVVWYMAFLQKISSYREAHNNILGSDTDRSADLLTITGENNKVILAINYDQLLYVKSSGNYLDIFYLNGENKSKELVRASLKELESKITDSSIVRIHRSYMVNKHRISSFKKNRKGYKLMVQHAPEEVIPVSIGYKDKFEEALELNLSH